MSRLLANIRAVAASVVMTRGYFVVVEAVPDVAPAASFTAWPATTLPVFIVNEPTGSVFNLNCSYCFYRKKELVCPSRVDFA